MSKLFIKKTIEKEFLEYGNLRNTFWIFNMWNIFFFKEKNVQKYKYIICDTLKIFKMWIGILQKKQVKNNDI